MGNFNAFNNEKYLKIQKENILKRINLFGGRLYLEFGGKLFDDYHAARVLPGFKPDSKLQMLLTLKDQCEVVVVINANDIKNKKIRGDSGRTYDIEVERLITSFRNVGLLVSSVVISFYEKNAEVDKFMRRLKNYKVNVYKHYKIAGYPQNIPLIVSEQGLGKNEYIEVSKPLVVVTAPGPGSGKMATCLSQLYHDNNKGIKAGYAKYETFPVWNLPLNHPVNMAYEAATIDLNDVNMIDPYHLDKYNIMAVNYNRDVETFPLLKDIFVTIQKESPYNSPTDMGVNMVGFAIEDDESYHEITNGRWLTDNPYSVIHRIVIDENFKGHSLASKMLDYCIEQSLNKNIHSIRIDTHKDNLSMQKFLIKNRFTLCGDITLKNGDPRIGFEKII